LDIGVLGFFGIVSHKEHPPEVWSLPPVTPCIYEYKAGKAIPLRAWSGPEGPRKLRYPDFTTTAQDGGKVVSLTHRPLLPPRNAPGTHFC